MPDFTKAEVATETTDLTPYRTFLKRLEVGQVVTLPLDAGERSRVVVRLLNLAAGYNGMRITRLSSGKDVIRFRVVSPARRAINISDEAVRARVEKAKATRAARRAGIQDEPTRMDEGEGAPDVASGDEPRNTALLREELITVEAVLPEQQVQEAAPARPARRRASKVAQNA